MSESLNWFEARDTCVSEGGRLVESDNVEKSDALAAKSNGEKVVRFLLQLWYPRISSCKVISIVNHEVRMILNDLSDDELIATLTCLPAEYFAPLYPKIQLFCYCFRRVPLIYIIAAYNSA